MNVNHVKRSVKMVSLCCCTWSVFILMCQLAVTKMEKDKISQNLTESESPYFVGSTKLFKGQLGSVAYLECSIINLNNMTMAWVRMRDRHILTVERETFISDRRQVKKMFYNTLSFSWNIKNKHAIKCKTQTNFAKNFAKMQWLDIICL